MLELPKIVRGRLQATKAAGGHPDADVLTAFAERALQDGERALVMEHLGRCADCRDVLARALPASATQELAGLSHPAAVDWSSRSILRWPVLGWGLAVAGIVAVASLGVLRHEQRKQTSALNIRPFSQIEVPRNEGADARSQGGPAQDGADAPRTEQRQRSLATPEANLPMPARPVSGTTAGSGRGTPRSEGRAVGFIGGDISVKKEPRADSSPHTKLAMAQPPSDLDFAYAAKPAAEPSAKQRSFKNLTGESAQGPFGKKDEAKSADAELMARNQLQDQLTGPTPGDQSASHSSQKTAEQLSTGAVVERAKPPVASQVVEVTSEAVPTQIPAPPTAGASLGALSANPSTRPHWTVNATGDLLRSFDAGRTWQAVSVDSALTGGSIPFHARESSLKAAKTANGKMADAEAPEVLERDALEKAKKIVFRSVVAIDSQVWAGGSGGVLYHSIDAGDHWTSIIPSSAGVRLSGDITAVEFADPQHGRVATSTFEVWTTADGGLNWQKQ